MSDAAAIGATGAFPSNGRPFKRADIKLGFDCHCNCLFCVVGDVLFTKDWTTQENKETLRKARGRCDGVVFTGGEPTMRPDFVELVAYAKELGFENIQVQTTGRMFSYMKFAADCVRAGLNDFAVAIHGPNPTIHDSLVRMPGSFDQIVEGIRNLKKLRQKVITNTVMTRKNAEHLPDLARLLVELKVDQYQLAMVHPAGHARRYYENVVPRMSEIMPWVYQAIEIGRAGGVRCRVESVPLCLMKGYEKHVSELYIPYTEISIGEHHLGDYRADRVEGQKARFPQCSDCRYEYVCEGPWKEYPERMGHDEFKPVPGAKVYHPEVLLNGQVGRLGGLAPDFSLPSADGRSVRLAEFSGRKVLLFFYPEDGSPGCTQEVCSLRDVFPEVKSTGVEMVGISPDTPEKHHLFQETEGLPFRLLSDPPARVARAYGAFFNGVLRKSFLIGEDRRFIHVWHQVRPDSHGKEVLDLVKTIESHAPVSV